MDTKPFDVIIAGAGAGGTAAAIFCRMRDLNILLIEQKQGGGQMMSVYPAKPVKDYPAFSEIPARELAMNMLRQVKSMGVEVHSDEKLDDIKRNGELFTVTTSLGKYQAKSVILAMGAGFFTPRFLGVIGENDFQGKGVLYGIPSIKEARERKVVCVGGGNSSLEAAITVADFAEKVTLVHRGSQFEAYEFYIDAVKNSSINIKFSTEVKEILGCEHVEQVILCDRTNKSYEKVESDLVVINIGVVPNFTKIKKWGIQVDKNGICVDREMKTSVEGIFACGDIVSYPEKLKLLIAASGEGSIAAESVFRYLKEKS